MADDIIIKPPMHLLVREPGKLGRIACGKAAAPGHFTDRYIGKDAASCKGCAKEAPGLTDEQRTDIWQNANDRLGRDGSSPWERKKAKAIRDAEKKARDEAKAAARAERQAKRKKAAPF